MTDAQIAKSETMIEIAKLYYLDGMSQDEISRQLHMSRSNISRLLAKSVEAGIVQITINDSRFIHLDVAHRIGKKYGLQDVIIVNSHSDAERTRRKAGEAVSGYLVERVQNGMLLGVTRGKIIYYASRATHNTRGIRTDAVQLMGCTVNSSPSQDSYMLTETFAQRLSGIGYVMPVPLMSKSKQLRDQLLQEPLCGSVVEKFSSVDIALLEIHSLRVALSSQFREPWLTKADSLQLSEVDAIASVCGRYFDPRGLPCSAGINDRVIAAGYDQLKAVPIRVGTAIGANMLHSTLAVLRSKVLTALIIDESLAFDLDSQA